MDQRDNSKRRGGENNINSLYFIILFFSYNDKRGRSRSRSSSVGRKFSISKSRSLSNDRKKDTNKPKRVRSHSRSASYRSVSGENRSRSRSQQKNGPVQRGPAMDFIIFIKKNVESSLTNENILKKIEDQITDVQFNFTSNNTIPDLNGSVLHIKSEDIKKKRDALQMLLDIILKNNYEENEEASKHSNEKISVLLLVPNGLVSMIIGTKGRQISNLIRDSGSNIVVNQPIHKMFFRTVSIRGKPQYTANAVLSIQNIMEERYYEVSKVEMEIKPLNVTTSHTIVKFVLHEECVNYLNSSRKAHFVKKLKDKYDVSINFYRDHKNRQFDKKDYVTVLKGTITSVQDAILYMVSKIEKFIGSTYDGKDSYSLRMLIHKAYVTKLIGAQGCMIQEIANFSGGASIKILSNKSDERRSSSSSEIIVCIAGSLPSVQDASCIIIEQMECFKRGGPVLKSGKNLNQNIAQQFINSIFCSASRKENEDDHCFTLKDRFMSKKRSRSRSRSKSHSKSKSGERKHKKSRYDEKEKNSDTKNTKNDNFNDYDTKDASNNVSYEEKGQMKISCDIIVPDYLVSLLIGKKGETIRGIMIKSGSIITFQKEFNDDSKIITGEGVVGRLCNFKGSPQQNATALQLISEMIIKLETSLNGVRKEK